MITYLTIIVGLVLTVLVKESVEVYFDLKELSNAY